MDIASERQGLFAEPPKRLGTPEWQGLRARLLAARAIRAALADYQSGEAQSCGGASFDCGSARKLADYAADSTADHAGGGPRDPSHGLLGVNPVFWANRKSERTKDTSSAEEISSGERG